MIKVASHSIITPLGNSADECFRAMCEGRSGLRQGLTPFASTEPFCASMFASHAFSGLSAQRLCDDATPLERLAATAVSAALEESPSTDPASPSTIFILSTTKGNIGLMADAPHDRRIRLSHSAEVIARAFGNRNQPLVVSNACISGVAAQTAASRLLESGVFDTAIIVGVELISRFIVAGFQSFKALSSEPCRPFDATRCGLNLGEGAGVLILTTRDSDSELVLRNCAIANDANHISGPSRTGEGSYRVLSRVARGIAPADIAFINAHGTATPYNDEMESIAITRAGLADVPVNSLKGFLGHTLGAAGVIETIISMLAIKKGIILPTPGYENCGTSRPLSVSDTMRPTDRRIFIKLISGFGGVNGAIAYERRLRQ